MALHKIVIVGAGFAGLQVARDLAGAPVDITIIDKRNHHLFQPLLYQVATTVLATSEIAWPIRTLFRDRPDIRTLLAEVVGVDVDTKQVKLKDGGRIEYDTLILATGARHAYFGHDEWEPFAPGLKTLEDATTIRRRLLLAFERAELTTDEHERRALMTFGIVGGGPTGVELAGIIAELAQRTLVKEFRAIDTRESRVILVEAGSRLLPVFPENLSNYAANELRKMKVDVRLGAPVTACDANGIVIGDEFIACRTVIWAAGVAASSAAEWTGAAQGPAGRAVVKGDLTIENHPEIFIIGDTAAVLTEEGKPVPGIAPAAKQQGHYVAQLIRCRLANQKPPRPFRYKHQGNLATIGPSVAVIDFGRLQLKGWLAWWIWGLAHVYFLIGTRSRLAVASSWLWTFLSGHRSSRLITQKETRYPEGAPEDD